MTKHYEQEPHAHYLTFSCYKHMWLFKHPELYSRFLDHLDQTRNRLGFKLWAFVVMPNHVHLLIYPSEQTAISQILYAVKKPFSHQAVRFLDEKFPEVVTKLEVLHAGRMVRRFWQRGGGYDRNIYGVEALRKTIDYIHYNPVSKGLAASPLDRMWSSARYWLNGQQQPISIDRPWFWDE